MENFKNKTLTELLKFANDAKVMHDNLKKKIIDDTKTIDDLSEKINNNIETLNFIEKNYVQIIEELNNRDAI